MNDIWIVLVEDRHSDVDAVPFSTEEGATAAARSSVPDFAEEEQLTPGMRKSGCVLLLSYGTEGDCVRVLKRSVDDTGRLRSIRRARLAVLAAALAVPPSAFFLGAELAAGSPLALVPAGMTVALLVLVVMQIMNGAAGHTLREVRDRERYAADRAGEAAR